MMKKATQVYLLLSVFILFIFSCSKQEMPHEKRSYIQTVTLTFEDVDYEFIYDAQNRVEKIVFTNQNYLFLAYNTDNSLNYIELMDSTGGSLAEIMQYTYSSDKITIHHYCQDELTVLYEIGISDNPVKELATNKKMVPSSINVQMHKMEEKKAIPTFLDHYMNWIYDSIALEIDSMQAKSTGIAFQQWLMYDRYDIVHVKTELLLDNMVQAFFEEELTYDNRNNPFYDLPFVLLGYASYNKHNVRSVASKFYTQAYDQSQFSEKYLFSHNYNLQGYPIKTIMQTVNGDRRYPGLIICEYSNRLITSH